MDRKKKHTLSLIKKNLHIKKVRKKNPLVIVPEGGPPSPPEAGSRQGSLSGEHGLQTPSHRQGLPKNFL